MGSRALRRDAAHHAASSSYSSATAKKLDARLAAAAQTVEALSSKVKLGEVVQLGSDRRAPGFAVVHLKVDGLDQKDIEMIGALAYDILNGFGEDAAGREVLKGKYATKIAARKSRPDGDGMVTLAMFENYNKLITLYPNVFDVAVAMPKDAAAKMGAAEIEDVIRKYAVTEVLFIMLHEYAHAVQAENGIAGGRVSMSDIHELKRMRSTLMKQGVSTALVDKVLDSRYRSDLLNEGMAVFWSRHAVGSIIRSLGLDAQRTDVLLLSLAYSADSYVAQLASKTHVADPQKVAAYGQAASADGAKMGGYHLVRSVIKLATETRVDGRTSDVINALSVGGWLRTEMESVDSSKKLLENPYRLGPTLWDIVYLAENEDVNRTIAIMLGCTSYAKFVEAVSSRFDAFVKKSLQTKLRTLEWA